MVLYGTDYTWMVWPVSDGWFEDDTLVVPFALPFRLDAVCAGRSLFATLYAAFPAGEATSLGSLPHLGIWSGPWIPGW